MASLKANTFYLYALTASNYLFGAATIPYLTRVLGPVPYGNLGFAMAVGVYFNLIIDFGFLLSGTKKVVELSHDKKEISKLFSAICSIKIVTTIILYIFLLLISSFILEFKETFVLLELYLMVALTSSLLPDYIYRGLEDMKMITIRGVVTRGIFTFLIFLFLKKPQQISLVPLSQLFANIFICGWIYIDILKRYKISICKISINYIVSTLKDSLEFFFSRIASSIYSISNTIVLGFFFPGSLVMGFYSSADKFKVLASQAASPVADSFFPYMIRTKNYTKLFRVLLLFEIPIIIICFAIYIYAKDVCIIAFGEDYRDAYELLRWMVPIIGITLPNYLLGFPALTPIGKAKWANLSVEIAMINQIIGLVVLCVLGKITAINLCILTLSSEMICLFIRSIILLKNHRLIYE